MSNPEITTIQIKNAKVNSQNINKICLCFSNDFTAIQTAKESGYSRQTINHYYKLFRNKIDEDNILLDYKVIKDILKQNYIEIKHINIYNHNIFYTESSEGIFILNEQSALPINLSIYLDENIKDSLIQHKKANSVRILYNKDSDSYITSGYFKSDNHFECFIHNRLRKFRGINKNNFYLHLKESIFRYNYNTENIYKNILNSFS
ncbi:hypothetical protein [Poseidonibacter lekithochrous]|uniref:hypothetical protein n=1 Tax=Poseidonibacter lekithochrous TaxID=1904463 RepID=UPI0008FCA726|nr:hypothetical protein [Poseidonibacter lekithochrous]QKJ21846.1 hypothetical protein ALEK_0543 [Poseidonibacter lekithochrous]